MLRNITVILSAVFLFVACGGESTGPKKSPRTLRSGKIWVWNDTDKDLEATLKYGDPPEQVTTSIKSGEKRETSDVLEGGTNVGVSVRLKGGVGAIQYNPPVLNIKVDGLVTVHVTAYYRGGDCQVYLVVEGG